MHTGRGIIAGVGHPISAEVYHVVGNKRVRLRRIIEWEKENQQTNGFLFTGKQST
jgi:hypothetical protein